MIPDTLEDGFPRRAAALDIGSNAIRYTTAEFSDPRVFVELEMARFPIRLGHDVFTSGAFPPETLDAVVRVGQRFRRAMDRLGIGRYRAVATSAVRESRNGEELTRRLQRECGIRLETITGTEEARLVWVAVSRRLDLVDRGWVLVDLGGGSMEVSIIDRAGIRITDSHPLGAVRLVERFQSSANDPEQLRDRIFNSLADLSLPRGGGSAAGVIATGGNAEVIADLVGAPRDAMGVSTIAREQLERMLAVLLNMTVAERIDRLGLRKDRADVIVPALIIYDRIAELAGCDRVIVPRVAVKEGIIYELVGHPDPGRRSDEPGRTDI